MYPADAYSVICSPRYKVVGPTIMQQVALVNTINAMRNYVAKGTPDSYPYLPPAANMKQITYNVGKRPYFHIIFSKAKAIRSSTAAVDCIGNLFHSNVLFHCLGGRKAVVC